MPWEMYFRLERPIRWRPDEASLRVRLVALMLSKRAEQGSCIAHSEGVAENTAQLQTWKILNAECWEHVARVCPVSVCTEWAVCPFDHWLDLPAAEFAAAYQHFEAEKQNVLGDLLERLDFDEDLNTILENEGRWEELDVILDQAQRDICSRAFGDTRVKPVSIGGLRDTGGDVWSLFIHLASRQKNVRPLGCMREGIPIDVAKPIRWVRAWFNSDVIDRARDFCSDVLFGSLVEYYDSYYDQRNDFFKPLYMDQYIDEWIFDSAQHFFTETFGFCFCTLDGLFAVDWDLDCSSGLSSGRHLRPSGKVRDVWKSRDILCSHREWRNLEDWLEGHSLSKLRDVVQRDPQHVSENMKEQLQRGHEAMILLDVHGQELDDEQDDAYHAYKSYLAGNWNGNRYPPPVSPRQSTRRQVLHEYASGDVDVAEALKMLEKRIIDAGADPAHFRLVVFFSS